MGNPLSEDLTGRYVVLDASTMAAPYKDIKFRVYKVEGGFGASPTTAGRAVFGFTPVDGEKFRIESGDIERFATEEEIAMVTSYDPHGGAKHRYYEEN